MHSGRAEAFGMLAALTFLHHYIQSYDLTTFEGTSINCFCENIGVVTTISALQKSTITRPNDTTNNDRDVFLAIHDIIYSVLRSCTIFSMFWDIRTQKPTDP